MCDFKPGDEVMCVDAGAGWCERPTPLKKGATYEVKRIGPPDADGDRGVEVWGVSASRRWPYWRSSRFRKVQRRDLTAWLATENTIEGPVRAPAKAVSK